MTLRFVIDAQLPPGLAAHLRLSGFVAEHVSDVGLGSATDKEILRYAALKGAVIVTKDADFGQMTFRASRLVPVLWIRIGNTTNVALWARLRPRLAEISTALLAGELLIEVG